MYKEIHDTPGGLRALIGAGFSLLDHPVARHVLAKLIVKEEEKIHGEDNLEEWQECVRKKAGSNKATAAFLDSIDKPGLLKMVKYRFSRAIAWMTEDPEDVHTRWGRIKPLIKSWVRHSFLPLFGVSLYIFDYLNREGYRLTKVNFVHVYPQIPLVWSNLV